MLQLLLLPLLMSLLHTNDTIAKLPRMAQCFTLHGKDREFFVLKLAASTLRMLSNDNNKD